MMATPKLSFLARELLIGTLAWILILAACTGALYHAINILIP